MGGLLNKKIPLSWLAVYVGAQLMCIGMIVMSSTGPAPAVEQQKISAVLHHVSPPKVPIPGAVEPANELADR